MPKVKENQNLKDLVGLTAAQLKLREAYTKLSGACNTKEIAFVEEEAARAAELQKEPKIVEVSKAKIKEPKIVEVAKAKIKEPKIVEVPKSKIKAAKIVEAPQAVVEEKKELDYSEYVEDYVEITATKPTKTKASKRAPPAS